MCLGRLPTFKNSRHGFLSLCLTSLYTKECHKGMWLVTVFSVNSTVSVDKS